MTNAYASVSLFKNAGTFNITGTGNDARIRQLLEDVSRQVDRWTKRHFYSATAKRYPTSRPGDLRRTDFSTLALNGSLEMILPADLIAVVALKEDQNFDGVFETSWAAADFLLWPYDADPTSGRDEAGPYRIIEVNTRSDGSKTLFRHGQRVYELEARWGYWERLVDTGATVNEGGGSLSATDTTLTVSNGALIEIDQTLLIGTEQLYVIAISVNDLTVKRGVNGTTAAVHANAATIQKYEYPGTVVEATVMQAGRLWTRRSSGFANTVGFTETGQLSPVTGLDEDVKQMLRGYIKQTG